jgi:hypothetical protein
MNENLVMVLMIVHIIIILAEYLQYYYGEIWVMSTFSDQSLLPRSLPEAWSFDTHCWISQKNILLLTQNLHWDSNPGQFRVSHLSSCNLLADVKNFVLYAVLLSYLVSELQKSFSPGLEPRTVFRDFGPRSCNLLAETNNSGLYAVLLSRLVLS